MSHDNAMRTIRIFISSPGDVAEERDRARRVIEGLRRRYSRHFYLKPVLWEDLPLQADASFQQGIDLVLSHERGIDIAIFVLWSRLGSALGPLIKKDDGSEYRSGTERELDLMLAAKNNSIETGKPRPALLVYTRSDDNSFVERLRNEPTSELENLVAQKKLVESFVREEFDDAESRHNLRAYHRFDTPSSFSERLRAHLVEVLDELAGMNVEVTWDIHKQGPPFLGLEAFQPEHAGVFFGRDEEILEARAALREAASKGMAFLLLMGASGSGKSSLARAGILPEIIDNEIDGQVGAWKSMIVTPAELALNPVLGLVGRLFKTSLLDTRYQSVEEQERLAGDLAKDPELTFRYTIRANLESRPKPTRLLLVIDQFEELFASNSWTEEQRLQFLRVIDTFARSGAIWVLATARSDFYQQIRANEILARLLKNREPMFVMPPTPDALQRMIEEPARLAGLRFEERNGVSLAGRILDDAVSHSEMLPLVGFVLRELYEGLTRQDDNTLQLKTYEKLGGVAGAVGKQAKDVFLSLNPSVQAALKEILPLLVTVEIGDEQAVVRRSASLADLHSTAERRQLVDCLVEKRLMTTEQGAIGRFAHEVVLRSWSDAVDWIRANREHLAMRSRVEQSQRRWEQRQRDDTLLLPAGLLLEEGRALWSEAPQLLEYQVDESSVTPADYIQRSIDFHVRKAEELAEERRRRTEELEEQNRKLASAAYSAHLNRAFFIAKSSPASALDILYNEMFCPLDLREFTWGLLNRICLEQTSYHQLLVGHRDTVKSVVFSPDGQTIASSSSDTTIKLWNAVTGRERVALDGHAGPVNSVSFSPDGRTIASGSHDKTVKLWDAATGQESVTLSGHTKKVTSVSFSLDGQTIVSGSHDKTIKLWDASMGQERATLSGHTKTVTCVSFSPDGRTIASCSDDTTIKLWDAATGLERVTLNGHTKRVTCVGFSPDGQTIASGSDDKNIKLWDAAKGQERITLNGHTGAVNSVRFSPDGRTVASASHDNTIKLWDAITGQERATFRDLNHSGQMISISFSPDGRTIVAGGSDNMIRLLDAAMEQERATLGSLASENWVNSVCFSPDGRTIASGFYGKTQLWDAATGLKRDLLSGRAEGVKSTRFSSDGRMLVSLIDDNTVRLSRVADGFDRATFRFFPDGEKHVLSSDGSIITLWDAATGLEHATLSGHTDSVTSICFSPDGRTIASGSHDETVKLWDAATGQERVTLSGHTEKVNSVSFSPDGQMVASGSADKTVKLWDAATGRERVMLTGHLEAVNSVSFSPDGRTVASGSDDKTIKLWDAATGLETVTLSGHEESVTAISFSPDGRTIASASTDGTIKLWDTAAGLRQVVIKGYSGSVSSFPDSPLIAFISLDKTIKMWDVTKGLETVALGGHTGSLNSISLSPDGRTLASGNNETVKLWDATTGLEAATLSGHTASVRSVGFSPDGRLIASGSSDTITVWDVATRQKQATLSGHNPGVKYFSFSPDGRMIASEDYGGEIKLWDSITGQERAVLRGRRRATDFASFSPDGRMIAFEGFAGEIKLWDTAMGQERLTFYGHTEKVTCFSFRPQGKSNYTFGEMFASGSEGNSIKLWNAGNIQLYCLDPVTYAGHTGRVRCISFSPDGNMMASGSEDNTIRLWSTDIGQKHHIFSGHTDTVNAVSFSPDGRTIASGSDDNTIKLWNTATGLEQATLSSHTGSITSICFSPDGQTLASGSDDNTIKLWDAVRVLERVTLGGHADTVNAVSFSPDGQTLASGSDDHTIKLWDTANGLERATLTGHTQNVTSVSFSPDGRTIASGGDKGEIKLWDAISRSERVSFSSPAGGVTFVCFSPDGETIAAGGNDGRINVLDVTTGQERESIRRPNARVVFACFSPDGQTIVSGGNDARIKLWDVATGQERLTIGRYCDVCKSCCFSPDGRTIALGSNSGTIQLLDPATGQEQAILRGHRRAVRSVTFSPDGRTLVSASDDHTIRFWDVDEASQELERRQRARLVVHGSELARAETNKQWFAACSHLHHLIHGFPENVDFRVRLGTAYAELGWWEEAIAVFRRLFEMLDVQFLLSSLLFAGGKMEELRNSWSEWAVAFGESDEADTLFQLASERLVCPVENSMEAEAILKWSTKALEESSEDPARLNVFGGAQLRAGHAAEAIKALKQSADIQTGDDERKQPSLWTRLHLALAYLATDNIDSAENIAASIPDLEPKDQIWPIRLIWRTLYPELLRELEKRKTMPA